MVSLCIFAALLNVFSGQHGSFVLLFLYLWHSCIVQTVSHDRVRAEHVACCLEFPGYWWWSTNRICVPPLVPQLGRVYTTACISRSGCSITETGLCVPTIGFWFWSVLRTTCEWIHSQKHIRPFYPISVDGLNVSRRSVSTHVSMRNRKTTQTWICISPLQSNWTDTTRTYSGVFHPPRFGMLKEDDQVEVGDVLDFCLELVNDCDVWLTY